MATVPKLNTVIDEVAAALGEWEAYAREAGVAADNTAKIAHALETQAAVSGKG